MTRTVFPLPTLLLLAACAPGEPPLTEQFPGDWQQDEHSGITQALTRNGVSDCYEMRYKQNTTDPQQYRVRCSRDDSAWQAYTVWVDSNDISGPYPAEPALD